MDYYSDQSQNTPPVRIVIQPNLFLVFSVIFAVLSWMCSCFALSTVFFGSLSIIFAVLSKGSGQKMISSAKAAVISSLIAMVFSTISTVASVYQVLSDPEMYQEFTTKYEQMTGISFEEELENLKEVYRIDF